MAAFAAEAALAACSSRDTNLLNGHHPLCNLTPLSSFKTLYTTNPLNSISYTHSTSFHRAPLLHIHASQVNAAAERTFVMIKPDGVQRGLVGEIISKFERKGFILKGLKLFQCPTELAQVHYQELKEKPFYPKLVKYITSGPVVCMAWEGQGVVASARKLIGVTNPLQAEPGTIRGDFAVETGRNVIHGSDSPQNGEREIGLWFNEEELCQWSQALTPWLRE